MGTKKITYTTIIFFSVLVATSGLVAFLPAKNADALIIDGGISVPDNLSVGDLALIDDLQRQVGTKAARDLLNTGGAEQFLGLARNTGVSNVVSMVQQSSGTLVG